MNSALPLRRAIILDGLAKPIAGLLAESSLHGRFTERPQLQETEAQIQPNDEQTGSAEPLNEWLAAVAERHDRAAFQSLFEFFAPRLKAFMYRQGAAADMAEEIVQETMVNVWRKAAQFDPAKASASTWIFTIARNQRIDLLRKENRPMPDMNDPALVPDPEPRAPDVISRRQEAGRLKQVVSDLPPEQQEVLRLAFFEEKAHATVAAELDIPLGTVKSRIRLAFRRIRAELGESQ